MTSDIDEACALGCGLPCPDPLCSLLRESLLQEDAAECARAWARWARIGQEVPVDVDAHCVNCGDPRSTAGSGVWLYAWTGRPVCGTCLAEDIDHLANLLAFLPEVIDEEELWP